VKRTWQFIRLSLATCALGAPLAAQQTSQPACDPRNSDVERRPPPREGFNLDFQPSASGRTNGPFEILADGFAGPDKTQGRASTGQSG
jgi:hypothetical protein